VVLQLIGQACPVRVTDGCWPSLIRCHAPFVARCRLVHLSLVEAEADLDCASSVPRLLSQVPVEFVREFIGTDGRLKSPPMTHGLDSGVHTAGKAVQFVPGRPVMNRRAEAVSSAMAAADVISPTGRQVGQETIVLAQTQVAAPQAQLASLQAHIGDLTAQLDAVEVQHASDLDRHVAELRAVDERHTAQLDAVEVQRASDLDRHVAELRAVDERHAKELAAVEERHAKVIADLSEAAANVISPAAELQLATLRATVAKLRTDLVGLHAARVQNGHLAAQLHAVKAKCESDLRELRLFTHIFIAEKLESGRLQCVSRCGAAKV